MFIANTHVTTTITSRLPPTPPTPNHNMYIVMFYILESVCVHVCVSIPLSSECVGVCANYSHV